MLEKTKISILIIAKKLGYKIKEIPVIWKNDPHSTVKFSSMLKMGVDLFEIVGALQQLGGR